MSTLSLVIKDHIILYGYIDRKTEERVNICAKLPNSDWDNERLNVLDWKIDGKTVKLAYQTRNDAYAPIFDCTLPVTTERIKLQRPNKSRYWKLDEYGDFWRNTKTRQKVWI